MKLTHVFGLVLALSLVLIPLPAQAACSNATVQGGFGYLLTGVNGSATLAAIVGQFTADGKGKLTGSATYSNDGVITSSVVLSGTYSIKANCSGIARIISTVFATANYNLNVVSGGTRIDMVDNDTGTTESGYALAQGVMNCTLSILKGGFAFEGGGFTSALVPVAFSGQGQSDGAGNLSGNETSSGGGTIFSGAVSGTYTINSDCTGTVSVLFNGQQDHSTFVLVNSGQSALQMQTDPETIITSTVTKP